MTKKLKTRPTVEKVVIVKEVIPVKKTPKQKFFEENGKQIINTCTLVEAKKMQIEGLALRIEVLSRDIIKLKVKLVVLNKERYQRDPENYVSLTDMGELK
jgi:hypothetical protein